MLYTIFVALSARWVLAARPLGRRSGRLSHVKHAYKTAVGWLTRCKRRHPGMNTSMKKMRRGDSAAATSPCCSCSRLHCSCAFVATSRDVLSEGIWQHLPPWGPKLRPQFAAFSTTARLFRARPCKKLLSQEA